tara:strand:- start:9593 stop:10594 length:1002 start_codon:yes stop_codon:yes gene_type:complete
MSIVDDYIQRQILTQRFINSLSRKYNAQLISMHEMVARMITKAGNTTKLEAIRRDIEFAIGESLVKFNTDMIEDLIQLSEQELSFVASTINANSKILLQTPMFEKIKEAIMESPLNLDLGQSRLTLGQALEEFEVGQAKAIRQVIFDGTVTGQTSKEMAANVRALSETRTKGQVDALTRTLSNHTTAQTRKEFALEYESVFDGEEWIAVLDSRTTLLCSGRDGTIYDVGMGPYPPAHWNCRSLRVPVIKENIDNQGAKANRENFDTWLRGQPKSFQDEFFGDKTKGKEKMALFAKGDLKLEKFRDESGREYSIDELKLLYSDEAKKANLKNGQ